MIRAFVGTTSGGTPIPLPPGWPADSSLWATNINNAGDVVGSVGPPVASQFDLMPWVGTASGTIVLPLPAGWSWASAAAVNDFGDVVGYGGSGLGGQPVFWGRGSDIAVVPMLPEWYSAVTYAVNNSGQMAGTAYGAGVNRAFVWSNTSGTSVLPLPPGWEETLGRGINDAGQVVGGGWTGTQLVAFVWSNTSGFTLIPALPGSSDMFACEVNEAGQVVGNCGPPGGRGWIWDPVNGTRALNSLVPREWSIGEARSINDRGQILAVGRNLQTGYFGPVLLDPVPEPATGVLLGCGLLLLACLRRRRFR